MSTAIYRDQFSYQREFAVGKILNVGSNTDGAQLGSGPLSLGAVNFDLRDVDHVTGKKMPVHAIGDARDLPYTAEFDTVVLGEILEHMEHADAVLTLQQAAKALKPGGRVVITMPHDARRDAGTLETPAGDKQFYVPPQSAGRCPTCNGNGGVNDPNGRGHTCPQCFGKKTIETLGPIYAYHYRSIPWAELFGWIAEAGLQVVERSRIQYVWGEVGSGVVCQRESEC